MAKHGYCFTINTYTDAIVCNVQGSVGFAGITYVCYGFERGSETDRPHMQGYLQATHDNKSRFQKKFGVKCHFEKQKAITGPSDLELQGTFGHPYTAIGYCMKDGDFHEWGEKVDIKPTTKGARNDLNEVKEAIDKGESYDTICETHFQQAAMYSKFIKERIQARDSNKLLDTLREQYSSSSLMPWQNALVEYLDEGVDPRKIAWIWDKDGNSGKSWMAKYLVATRNACYLSFGRKSDLTYIFSQDPKPIVVFNLSRTTAPSMEEHENNKKNFLDGIYSLAEDLKDGILVNTKYEAKTVMFEVPHVIFFANFEPDRTKWSADRYDVTNMTPMDFTPP